MSEQETHKFPDHETQDQFIPYITQAEIQNFIKSLAHSVSQKYKGQELIIIGPLSGSIILIADLVREIRNVELQIDFIKLSALNRNDGHPGTIRIVKDISIDIRDKNVLIVEEIVDTGRALDFLKKRLLASSPKSVEILTLFNKPYKRTLAIEVDWIGKQIEDQFIIGYGLDLEGLGRNLNDVYYLQFPQ